CRLNNWQFRCLRPFENTTRVSTGQSPRLRDTGSVAHQSSPSDSLDVGEDCREAMPCCQSDEVSGGLKEKRVLSDKQHRSTLLRDRSEGSFEITFAGGWHHQQLLADCFCDRLHVAQFFQTIRAVWMREQRNQADIWNELACKLKSLGAQTR